MNISQRTVAPPEPWLSLYVVASLRTSELHAYMIGQQVIKLSGGTIVPSRSAVKGALERMEQRGWVEQRRPSSSLKTRQRSIYSLTAAGQTRLRQELFRLRRLLTLMR